MSYEIRGTLLGAPCDECREPLTGLEVRAYQSIGEQTTVDAVAAEAAEKETFRSVADGERGPYACG
jgi:hypothetical protein